MTIGSIIEDLRVPRAGATGSFGRRRWRDWSGSNSIPGATPRRPRPKLYEQRKKLNKFGRMVWVKTRVFPRFIAPPKKYSRRSLPPNPYGITYRTENDQGLVLTDGREFSCEAAGVSLNISLGVTDPNLKLKVINQLRVKIQGSDFNAGIVLAEAHKTAALVAQSAMKIAKALVLAKRGRMAEAAYALTGRKQPKVARRGEVGRAGSEILSQRWLELQYGWYPLLSDVESSAQALAHKHLESSVVRFVARGQRSIGLPSGKYPDPANSSTVLQSHPQYTAQGYQAFERYQIIAHVSSYDSPGLLGLKDVASVAWELVPYSFVVDWFIPIGSYLSALSVSRSLTGTFVTTEHRLGKYDAININWPEAGFPPRGFVSKSLMSLNRTVLSTLDVPLPAVKPIAKIATLGHGLNALALVVTGLKSKFN